MQSPTVSTQTWTETVSAIEQRAKEESKTRRTQCRSTQASSDKLAMKDANISLIEERAIVYEEVNTTASNEAGKRYHQGDGPNPSKLKDNNKGGKIVSNYQS